MHSTNLNDPIELGCKNNGLDEIVDTAIDKVKTLVTEIKQLPQIPKNTWSWETTFHRLDLVSFWMQEAVNISSLLSMTHPDSAIRNHAFEKEHEAQIFANDLYKDKELADILREAAMQIKPSDEIQEKFIRETLRDFRREGLELPEDQRTRLKTIDERLIELGQTFEKNIAESRSVLSVREEQLDGLPGSYKKTRKKGDDGLIEISTDYPDYIPFIQYAHDRETAKKIALLFGNRAKEKNLPLLDEILKLRKEKAELLGYASWADFQTEVLMSKTPEQVDKMLSELHEKLQEKRSKEYQKLKEYAEKELHWDISEGIRSTDNAYLTDRYLKTHYQLDTQELSRYFEVSAVRKGVCDIASELYDIRFEEAPVPTWHEDVHVLDLFEKETDEHIGRLYLDLHPRENKFGHAAMFDIRGTKRDENNARIIPIAALVCNFPKPQPEHPACLDHNDVVTFFHEFGHALHHLLSKTRMSSFSGTNVVRDFVEVPSQIFEEWAWDKSVLDRFAKHVETKEQIPQELYDALINARTFGSAIFTERQILLSEIDQTYHKTSIPKDTTAVITELTKIYSPFIPLEGTHMQAGFGHLVGYDARYYGYQWAKSIAIDMFTEFQKQGIMNKEIAKKFKNLVLERGSEIDEERITEDFLGRPSTPHAYAKYLGI